MQGEQKINLIVKKNIEISHTVLQTLVKTCESSLNNNLEGVLFGHEDEKDKIHIEHAIPLRNESNDVDIIVIYIKKVSIS
jgi:hypothetical protein